jgi:hypothetical protein
MTDTADAATENVTAWHRARFAAAMLDTAGLKRLPPPQFLVEDLLQLDSTAELYGRAGLGKSFVGLDLALHVAVGRPWHGLRVHQGPVVYVTAEAPQGMGQRAEAWEQFHGIAVPPGAVTWLTMAVQLGVFEEVEAFRQLLAEAPEAPVLVVFDTRARCTVGVEENSNRDIGAVFAAVDELRRQTGACVLTLHHPAAGAEKARGATAYLGAVDTELVLKANDSGFDLRVDKQRNAPPAKGLSFSLQSFGTSAVVVAGEQTQREGAHDDVLLGQLAAIAVEGEAVSRKSWFTATWEALGVDPSADKNKSPSEATLKRAVKKLVESARVEKVRDGYYRAVTQ